MYVLLLIDNEPAGHVLTKGFENCKNLKRLPQVAWCLFEKQGWRPAWQPVMSSANVSDGVSRFDFAFAEKHGWEWCSSKYALFQRLLSAVLAFLKEKCRASFQGRSARVNGGTGLHLWSPVRPSPGT